MQTLELECPACSELLELDMGFAGGVCRCSACGTLMTVPQDAQQGGQAEQLSRPERPDDPSGLSGVMPAESHASPSRSSQRPVSRRSPVRSGKRKGTRKPKGKATARGSSSTRSGGRIEQGVYTTASGKTVQIDRAMEVPTASARRTGVRIATTVVFFAVVLFVVVIGAVAVIYMLQNPKGGNPDGEDDDTVVVDDPTQFTYQPSANPYLIEQPNVMGMPISGTVAIVIEVGPDNANWLEPAAEMIGTGLTRPGGDSRLLLYAPGPEGVRSYRRDPVAPATVTADLLVDFVGESSGTGTAGVSEAIERALDASPTMLILVCGQPGSDDILLWEESLAGHADLAVHAVMVSGFSPAFKRWINSRRNGRFISLTASDLLDWRDEWVEESRGGPTE